MINFEHVSKRYAGGMDALLNINLQINSGQMVFLTGHSGAGKSTLLKLIALIETASRGNVYLDGENLNKAKHRNIPYIRRKIGMTFQNNQLLFDRTVFDNVALPLIVCGYSHRDLGRRVRAALNKVGLLSKERRNPITLSGGEQQRVGIARAIVNKPKLLLADEPTGNLDPEMSAEVMSLFSQFNQVGVTVIIASHDLQMISRLPYPVLTLQQGQLV